MKSIEQHFADWESQTFGYGYGTGEKPVLEALRTFLSACSEGSNVRAYDYKKVEDLLGRSTTWLLINVLARADIIEYGSSPRFGWLTKEGEALAAFVGAHTVEDLVGYTETPESYSGCFRDLCQCEAKGRPGVACGNPFWKGLPVLPKALR